jgi:hypothetical protein
MEEIKEMLRKCWARYLDKKDHLRGSKRREEYNTEEREMESGWVGEAEFSESRLQWQAFMNTLCNIRGCIKHAEFFRNETTISF